MKTTLQGCIAALLMLATPLFILGQRLAVPFNPGNSSCTQPSYTNILSARNTPVNTCTGSNTNPCLNGQGQYEIFDLVGSATATQTSSAYQPIFMTSVKNGQPADLFTAASGLAMSLSGIGTISTSISGYAPIYLNSVGSGVNHPILGSGASGGFEWRIDSSGNQDLVKAQTVEVCHGNATFSIHTWYGVGFTYNPSTGVCSFYTYASGSASSDGGGTNAQSFSAATDDYGYSSEDGEFFDGYLPETGLLNGIGNIGVAAWLSCKYGI